MVTFFEISAFENWSDDMFKAVNSVGYDKIMVDNNRKWV